MDSKSILVEIKNIFGKKLIFNIKFNNYNMKKVSHWYTVVKTYECNREAHKSLQLNPLSEIKNPMQSKI